MRRSRAPQIAVVVLSTVAQVFVINGPSVAQQRDRFKASWSKGHGDCGVGDNGTGFIANFNVDAEVIRVGKQRTITFIGAATGPIFKPVTGLVKADDTFVLEGREEKKDENYTFRGRVRANVIEGTYTRLAHYRGTSRCTAEWTVLIPTGQVSPPTPTTQADDAVIEPALQLPNVVRVSFVQFDAMNVIEDLAGTGKKPRTISDYYQGCTGTKGAAIQWVDCAPAFPDGITEKNWPIVVPRNTALVIQEARFVSNKDAPLTNPKVRGSADLGGGRVAHFKTDQVTQKGNTLIAGRMIADTTLPDKVKSYDDLAIKWTVSAGGSTYRAESSEHPVYVVLGKPRAILLSDDPEPYLTLVDLTVHESEGMSTERDVVDATFRAFKSRDIHRRDLDEKSGTVRRNGGNNAKLLQYWTSWTLEDQLAGKYQACRCKDGKCRGDEHYSTYSILSSQVGRCGAWANFFVKTLAVQGVSSAPKLVSDYPGFPKGPAGADGMLVKHWTFGTPTGSGDFNYESDFDKVGGKVTAGAKAEVKDAAGLAGQGAAVVPNPPGWFTVGGHAIVDYGGKLWDPSYGVGPFDTILDWARAALDGYAKIEHTPTKAVVRFHKGVEAPPPE